MSERILPYISKLKSIENIKNDDFFSNGIMENDLKIKVPKESKASEYFVIVPKGTFFSIESQYIDPSLEHLIDSDSFKTMEDSCIPLEEYAYLNDIDKYALLNKGLHVPFDRYKFNSGEEFIFSPDYSKESIEYRFVPSIERVENKPTIKSIERGKWTNPLYENYREPCDVYDVNDAWYNALMVMNEPELAQKLKETPKEKRMGYLDANYPNHYSGIELQWLKFLMYFIKENDISIDDIVKTEYDSIYLRLGTKVKHLSILIDRKTTITFKHEPHQSLEAVDKRPSKQIFLSQEQIDKLLEIKEYKEFEEKNINERDWLISIFSHRTEKIDGSKKVNILPPLIPIEGYFTLPAKTLQNQPEEIFTTAGLYVFNLYVISAAFKHKIPYINHEMKSGDIEDLNDDLAFLLLDNKIQVKDELEVYWNNITFISYLTEMFMPGLPISYLEESPKITKKKEELVKTFQKQIDEGDAAFYADNVEKPLLDMLKEEMQQDDESWQIYKLGKKPTFNNNVKVNLLSVGPIKNPATESYDIVTNSFDDGVDISKYAAYSNQLISGTYDRSIKTAYGGAKTKQLFSAMSDIILDKPGSDCGTIKTLTMTLEKSMLKDYYYCYIIDPRDKSGKTLIELTPEIIKQFIGQEIQLRTPLYCQGERYCNKCMGNLLYRMGIDKVGLITPRITSSLMYISMKSFHDSSIKTTTLDLERFFI